VTPAAAPGHSGNTGATGSRRALVLHPYVKRHAAEARRTPEARLEEACGLARAIGLDIAHAEAVPMSRPKPGTLVGEGKIEDLAPLIENGEIEVVVVDAAVTPVQQRNLEKAWKTKVIDRTGLILEIFGERARTREGRLQVELAHLSYQRSRLVRSWTHLERQRGGFGFLGGPGESQLEMDRRLIGDRIVKIKKELEGVVRTRELHRRSRRKVPYPIVALVGYTNAGKSTLFNTLTRAEVMAEDLLFATLDPTMRQLALPSGRKAILSDTVGFISELPHQLVAAFKATLEEVLEADIILHVHDASHPDSEAQAADVREVLHELGVAEDSERVILQALNKLDRLPQEEADLVRNRAPREPGTVAISALGGEGLPELLRLIDERLSLGRTVVDLDVDLADGATIAWLYRHGEVVSRHDDETGIAHLKVGLDPSALGQFESRTLRG